MPIKIKNFGGIVPKLASTELPENGAQLAQDCDLVSQTLRPFKIKDGLIDIKTNGVLNGNLDESKVFKIPIPESPSIIEKGHLAQNLDKWIRLRRGNYVVEIDDEGNERDFHVYYGREDSNDSNTFKTGNDSWIAPSEVVYTDTGAELTFNMPQRVNKAYYYGRTYTAVSYYEMQLIGNFENGGPDQDINMPKEVNGDYNTYLPLDRIPLTRNGSPGDVYGYLEIADANKSQIVVGPRTIENPNPNGPFVELQYSSGWIAYSVTIRLDFNYLEKRRQYFHYVQTAVRDRGEYLIESEPSEVSEKMIIMPGEYVKLSTPLPSGENKNNLYRSGNSADEFRLIQEVDNNEWTDYFEEPLFEELGLFGSIPDAPISDFLEGSILHPAQFGVAYQGNILYLSDFNKFHVWPSEYTIEFADEIKAIMLSGNTIIVFSGESVFGVSGGSPASLSKYLLSNTAPLLNKLSLSRIGNRVFYTSTDGLMMISSGGVVNLTKNHYTRNEWSDLNPSTFYSKVADDSLFLEGDLINLRFDLDEQINAVSSFTSLAGDQNFLWKSRKFNFEQKEIIDYVKIDSDSEVILKVYGDGELIETLTCKDKNPVLLCNKKHYYDWEFTLEGSAELRSLEAFERNIVAMGDSINLSPENDQAWRLSWLKFPDMGSFAGGVCISEDGGPVQVEFYHETLDLYHVETVFSGRAFRLPSIPAGNLWKVSIPNKDHVVRSITLFSRRRQIFNDSIHEFRVDPSIQPWAFKTYETMKPLTFSSAQIKAFSYPVKVDVYGDDQLLYSVEFANDKPIRLPYSNLCKKFSFEIDEQSNLVNEFAIATSMVKLKV